MDTGLSGKRALVMPSALQPSPRSCARQAVMPWP